MRANRYDVTQRFQHGEQLFDLVEPRWQNARFLEFGVFRGAVTRYWPKLLRNPARHLRGFGSFEGLPENFLPNRPAGYFSLRGKVSQMDDSGVRFFKGWFEQTLADYALPPTKSWY